MTTETSDDEVVERIERAIRQLPVRTDRENHVGVVRDALALMCRAGPGIESNAFHLASKKTTDNELKKLSRLVRDLRKQFEDLHGPAIQALADRGAIRGHNVSFLEQLKTDIDAADPRDAPDIYPGGRPEKLHARALASVAMGYYEKLTGHNVTLPEAPGLGPFVREIFRIGGLNANHRHAIAAIVEERSTPVEADAVSSPGVRGIN